GNVHNIEATEGGQVLATNLASITKAPLTILADGAASVVDLRGLRESAGQGGYFITFEARNGGTVSVPQLAGGPLVAVKLEAGGVMPAARSRRLRAADAVG